MENMNIEDQLLDGLGIFSEHDLKIFEEYGIKTVSELLSATKGLERFYTFQDISEKHLKLEKLREIISDDILEKHKEFLDEHPVDGVIEDEED